MVSPIFNSRKCQYGCSKCHIKESPSSAAPIVHFCNEAGYQKKIAHFFVSAERKVTNFSPKKFASILTILNRREGWEGKEHQNVNVAFLVGTLGKWQNYSFCCDL